jgi:hypothetical protein
VEWQTQKEIDYAKTKTLKTANVMQQSHLIESMDYGRN